jgi:acetyl-CoA synthetase
MRLSAKDKEWQMTTFAEAREFLLTHRADYATAYKDFAWPDPAPFNWAIDWFDKTLAVAPESRNRLALWIVDDASNSEIKLTFEELSRRSNQAANWMRRLGVKKGSRLLLVLGNMAPLWEIMLAAMKLGAVVIPATTLLPESELSDRIRRGQAAFVFTSKDQIGKFPDQPGLTRVVVDASNETAGWHRYDPSAADVAFAPTEPSQPADPILLYFTSGTTSKPKLVVHSQRSYPIGHLSTMYWLGLRPGDIHLNISSPGWAKHAWSCFFAPWIAGATVFICNQPRFEARRLLDVLARCEVTTLCAPPTVWRMLVQLDLGSWKLSLRELASAGEPLNPEVIEQIQRVWGLTIRDGYGQTETSAQIGNPPGQRLKVGSMGRPLPGYKLSILDVNGNPAAEGEICLPTREERPAGLMSGYEVGGILEQLSDQNYRTGDVVTRDSEGYITFVGRSDDVFKSADYRISPFELESMLIEHPAVAEAAVVPSPDPIRLAIPKAFISLVIGSVQSREVALSIFEHIREQVAPFKRIRRLEFVNDLPKTISGKIRRVQLRAVELKRDDGSWPRGIEYVEDDFPELSKNVGAAKTNS